MTIYERQKAAKASQREQLRRAIECALAKHGSVRAAAAVLGMPKSTLFDLARMFDIPTGRAAR